MSDSDGKSTSVIFLCGAASDGTIGLCDRSLFEKAVHEVATNRDDLIALCHDGCYHLDTAIRVNDCRFKASNFCAGTNTTHVLSSDQHVVYSWGEGTYGELGLGLCKTRVQEPAPVRHKSSFNSISSGHFHCIALDHKGNAYSWGQNFDRQLGLYSNDSSKFDSPNYMVEEVMFVPSLLPFSLLNPIKKVSCGARFTVAIGMNGDLWSWGAGECGQLGTGLCTKKEAPSKVLICKPLLNIDGGSSIVVKNSLTDKNLLEVADVACGDSHVLAVGYDGSTYTWGLNNRGQLGLGDADTRHYPSLIPSFTCIKVYANGLSSAGINAAGDLYTWGSGSKFRLMQQTEQEQGNNRLGDNTHKFTPTYVDALYGNIVKSFVFSRTGSAALVVTRLYELNPPKGPQKSFKEIQIHGCGFWDSDRIIVKFQKIPSASVDILDVDSNPIPRSAVGRLIAPGIISCRPPRLAESGDYEVTVSLDGELFVKDVLLLRIYPDVTVCSVYPRFLDIRSTDTAYITMVLGGLTSPPLDENVDDYDVKLIFKPVQDTEFDRNTLDSLQEFTVKGTLKWDSCNSTEVENTLNEVEGTLSATALNYRIVCEISDALKCVTASKLYSLQARISFNRFDFSEIKKDSECIILCHSFNPLSISPNSCLSSTPTPSSVTSSSFLSNETEKVLEIQSSRSMMKEICVLGESFFPSKCLPPNHTVQAIVTAIFPILTSETETKEEIIGDTINFEINNTTAISTGYTGVNTVSTVVPVRCTSQRVMYFTPPTINHFIDLLDKKGYEEEYNLIKTAVQFQLVSKDNAAARETSVLFPTHDKKDYSKHTTEEIGEIVQWLCPPEIGTDREDLVLHLFTNQSIIISPAVTRRHGGTAHKVRGALHGGFRCCPYPELVRVLLKTEGDYGEVLIDQPQVTVHKERTSAVIKTVLTQDEDTAVTFGPHPSSAFHHLTDLDAEFKYHFVMPDANTSVQQGISKPLQYVVTSLLFDDDSDTLTAPSFRLLLFDGVKIGVVVNPKGGYSQGSQVTVAVTGIPDCVKNCIIQIRGDEKDKIAMSIIPPVSPNYVEILGVQVRDGNQEISFLLPELSSFQILTPIMMKKAKMYFIHISIDEGSSFDSSAAAVLQIQ